GVVNLLFKWNYSVSGTKPQVLPAIVRPDIQVELFAMAVGTYGISSSEHATPFCCLRYVFQGLYTAATSGCNLREQCGGKESITTPFYLARSIADTDNKTGDSLLGVTFLIKNSSLLIQPLEFPAQMLSVGPSRIKRS
ncbi:hypothetical protein HHI36_009714, partial [Cryptolaemus montrouzieri]